MFGLNRNNSEFFFLEEVDSVKVYKLKGTSISKAFEFPFGDLSSALVELKRKHPEIIKSKNVWIFEAKVESIEKVPLNKEEMIGYAKWKVQELIDVPLHDVSYDLLTNNERDNSFYKKYATVIIEKKLKINTIIETFAEKKIQLNAIDSFSTSLLGFFSKDKEFINKKSMTLLRIEQDQAYMYVYYDGGLAFERGIELPVLGQYSNNLTAMSQETYQGILDKICLEIQRNVDFLDRQYGVSPFEYLAFSAPHGFPLVNLQKQIAEYFNAIPLDLNGKTKFSSAEGENIQFQDLALFEREKNRDEVINLLPKKEVKKGFVDDLKKIVMGAVLLGFVFSVFGSFNEWKARGLVIENETIEKYVATLRKELSDLKSKTLVTNEVLEREIDNLVRNKEEVVRLQSQVSESKRDLFQNVVKDIAIKATSVGVFLNVIDINKSGIRLEGHATSKEAFALFLEKLKEAESLKGKSIQTINMDKSEQGFSFKVFSEGMGVKK